MNARLRKTSAILLAGGSGTRMQTQMPKQFLQLGGKSLAQHSFDLFMTLAEIDEIVVVCAPTYRSFFPTSSHKPVLFALPGERRQDSVFNGISVASAAHDFLCIHDAARPFIDHDLVLRVLRAGYEHGAATVGVPVKFTIKESDAENFVKNTPDRSFIWEIQTPQIIQRKILLDGFRYAKTHNLTVTDDVSLAELVGCKVKLVEGSQHNLKVTVPLDFLVASHHLQSLQK